MGKAVLRGKCIVLNACIRKQFDSLKLMIYYFKKLKKNKVNPKYQKVNKINYNKSQKNRKHTTKKINKAKS